MTDLISTPVNTHDVDPIDADDLTRLCGLPGPWVTICLPTHRHGPDTRQDPLLLRQLVDLAAADPLLSADSELRDAITDRILDHPYDWQRSGDGLVVAANRHELRVWRVDYPLPRRARVGDEVWLRPLVGMIHGSHRELFILAVSASQVRLWHTRRHLLTELRLDLATESPEERDHQLHLQYSSQGGGRLNFHGHGGDGRAREIRLERHFRQVAAAVAALGLPAHLPLILACVREHRDPMLAVLRHPAILDEIVPGNPHATDPWRLHAAAWEVYDRVEEPLAGFGDGSAPLTDPGDITEAAGRGRVDSLFLGSAGADDSRVAVVDDPLAVAAAATVRTGGSLWELPSGFGDCEPVDGLASLRW